MVISEGGSPGWVGPVADHPRRAIQPDGSSWQKRSAQSRRSASIRSAQSATSSPLAKAALVGGPPSAPPADPTGYLSEVFASVEGEGLFAGEPAVFVRLAGCNLRCSYCDTKYAWENPKSALVHRGGATLEVPNPVAASDVVALIADSFGDAAAVFTGGEPLLQADFLGIVMRDLRSLGYRIRLETNGTLSRAYGAVRDDVDFLSMDIKLPSTQGGKDISTEHLEFLRAAAGRRVAVKIVVTPDSEDREIEEAARLVASANRFIPVFLQPAFLDGRPAVGSDQLVAVLAAARRHLLDVRVSIQMHKVIGAR